MCGYPCVWVKLWGISVCGDISVWGYKCVRVSVFVEIFLCLDISMPANQFVWILVCSLQYIWISVCGCECMWVSVCGCPCGHQCRYQCVWCKCVRVSVFVGISVYGYKCVGISVCVDIRVSVSGHQCVWTSVCVSISVWISMCGLSLCVSINV